MSPTAPLDLNREPAPCMSNELVFRPEIYEAAASAAWIEDECCTTCGWSLADITKQVNQVAYDAIQKILAELPDEVAKKTVLSALLANRCRTCLDYDPRGQFWCCNDSRGDRI